MDSNFYFYFGVAQQWLLANGAKRRNGTASSDKEPIRIKYFDDMPKGAW